MNLFIILLILNTVYACDSYKEYKDKGYIAYRIEDELKVTKFISIGKLNNPFIYLDYDMKLKAYWFNEIIPNDNEKICVFAKKVYVNQYKNLESQLIYDTKFPYFNEFILSIFNTAIDKNKSEQILKILNDEEIDVIVKNMSCPWGIVRACIEHHRIIDINGINPYCYSINNMIVDAVINNNLIMAYELYELGATLEMNDHVMSQIFKNNYIEAGLFVLNIATKSTNNYGYPYDSFIIAIKNNSHKIVEKYIEKDFIKNDDLLKASIIAVQYSDIEIIKMLIAKTKNHYLLLSSAVEHNKTEICKFLLKAGASMYNAQVQFGLPHRLIRLASERDYPDILELLLTGYNKAYGKLTVGKVNKRIKDILDKLNEEL